MSDLLKDAVLALEMRAWVAGRAPFMLEEFDSQHIMWIQNRTFDGSYEWDQMLALANNHGYPNQPF